MKKKPRITTTNEIQQPSNNHQISSIFVQRSADQLIIMCRDFVGPRLTLTEQIFILDAINNLDSDCTFFQAKKQLKKCIQTYFAPIIQIAPYILVKNGFICSSLYILISYFQNILIGLTILNKKNHLIIF